MFARFSLISLFALSCLSVSALAEPIKDRLIISNCKLAQLKDRVKLLSKSKEYSLVEVLIDDELLQRLHTNESACGKFLNVEPYYSSHSTYKQLDAGQLLAQLTQDHQQIVGSNFKISHQAEVLLLLQMVNPEKIWQTSQHLTSYLNRSASSESGLAAANWYKDQFDTLAQENKRTDVNSYFVKTGTRYKQPSVVTVIGKDKPGDAVVIGAHIDTLSGNMPGADDDASGISVALELSRVLLTTDLSLDHPVYIIAYSAEELGLIGSSYVVQDFLNKKIPVKAVMQLDQAGFRANAKDQTIWLLDDYVDKSLTKFTADLLRTYIHIPVAYTHCGYACSDHANWTKAGFKAAYPSATTLDNDNPYVHTSDDRLEIVNREHMVNFTKLSLSFAAELALN